MFQNPNSSYQLNRPSILFLLLLLFLSAVQAGDRRTDSLLQALDRSRSTKEKAEICTRLSGQYLGSNFRQALDYGQQAAFWAQQVGQPQLMAEAYKGIASAFFYMGIYDQALHYFDRYGDECRRAGNIFEQLNAQINAALIYAAIGEHRKSIDSLVSGRKRLLLAYRDAGKEIPLDDQLSVFLNLGYNHVELKQYKQALLFLDSGLVISERKPQMDMIRAKLLQTKAKALLGTGKYDETMRLLTEADSMLTRLADKPALILIKGLFGNVMESKGEKARSLGFYHEGFEGANAVGSLMLKQYFARELAEGFEAMNRPDSALKYLNLLKGYEKEASSNKAREELGRKELLQDFARKEAVLLQEQKKQQRNYLLFIAGITILLILLFFGYRKYKQKYRDASLKQLKWQLEAEALELEREQLQTRIEDQQKQLTDLEYKQSKNAMLQTLVGELQSIRVSNTPDRTDTAFPSDQKTQGPSNKIWDEFDIRFLQTHAGFYERLMNRYPDLTMNERRLCAFLLLDMSTKEISVITGQSVRAIEVARTRLRRKLDLTQSEQSLFAFLSSI